MEVSKIQGLPAHPLFVHIPVMFIPLCALLVVAYVVRPRWRESMRLPVAALVAFTTIATVIAAGSGEKLESMMSPEDRASSLVHQHTELGDQTKAIVIVFGAIVLLYFALDWYKTRNAGRTDLPVAPATISKALAALGIAAILLGSLSTVWDIRTGHAGAKATWHDALETAGTGSDNASLPANDGSSDSGVVITSGQTN